VLDEPGLSVPHPRMKERAFVLVPLLDLDADPVLPDGTRVLDLPFDPSGVRAFASPLELP
jgi:2-amino-4-hydroxy-6-hydroxymethyldihydropteridine diphosphokinase